MLHEPASQSGRDPAAEYKARLGLWMFLFYCLVYAGFVVINLADPKLMEATVVWDLNLAVVYGMGLILFAVILAVLYDLACRRREAALAGEPAKKGGI
jgi:uncharacterized membrane protein (DUF485 family)